MEHKLITGGEQYLPFARSRIKAMRATGLKYASQQFEVDGCSIKVRIEPGQEYITLSGGSGILDMDSGVIDPGARAGEGRFLPGTFYETDHPKTYNAPYQVPKDGGWRAAGQSNQSPITGRISNKGGFISGLVRDDASESRQLLRAKIKDDSTPPVWSDDVADQAMADKKLMMHSCPASIFTGRCRLYVQAMYGRPTYSDKVSKVAEDSPQGPATSGPTSAGFGALSLPSVQKKGVAYQQDVGINTSSGVFLDPETGNHWLFNPSVGSVAIYPLISSTQGEKWRKYLKRKPDVASQDDIEHLEAAILSECRPDILNVRTIPIHLPYVSSMGYGMHWNWDGLNADIVVNSTFDQGWGYTAMESTHYRLVMTPSTARPDDVKTGPTRVFKAVGSIIEGPSKWALQANQMCIAEPLWVVENLFRSTPNHTLMFSCDAPFYVFYTRNDIKVCRVTVAEVTHPISNISIGISGDMDVTVGLAGGSRIVDGGNPNSFDVTFSVGGVSLPVVTSGFFSNKTSLVVSGKTIVTYGYGPLYGYRREDGSVYYVREGPVLCSYEVSRHDQQIQILCQVAFAIPYNDSECVYVRAFQDRVTTTGQAVTNTQQNDFLYAVETDGVAVITEQGQPSGSGASTPTSSSVVDAHQEIVRDFDVTLQFGKSGASQASIPDGTMVEFSSLEGLITDSFITYSGVRVSTPCIYSGDKGATVGTGGHDDIQRPVLIGWI